MVKMKIYQREKQDGLEKVISEGSVLAYVAPASQDLFIEADKPLLVPKFCSAHINNPDLYYCYSILVSTNWNKNDDVFTPQETWAARHSPEHKPTNIEHDDTSIVGHIVSNRAIDASNKLIEDDTEVSDLPSFFHIVNGSVIYKQWRTPELKEKVGELIEQIEAGEKFVSMECIFKGFDYAVKSEDEISIIGRNEATAFLTKHLRAYGGSGEFENYKVGRVLRNILFSGKGFVDRPANDDSIIFSNDVEFDFAKAVEKTTFSKSNGVLSLQTSSGENFMSQEIIEKQLAEAKEEAKRYKAEADKAKEAAEKASKVEMESLKESLAKAEKELKDSQEKVAALESTIQENEKSNKELSEKLTAMETANKTVERVSHLIANKISEEDAKKYVEHTLTLSDEAFEEISKGFKAAEEKTEEKIEKKVEKKTEEKSKADDVDLDDVDTDDSVANSDSDEENTARAKIAEWAVGELKISEQISEQVSE